MLLLSRFLSIFIVLHHTDEHFVREEDAGHHSADSAGVYGSHVLTIVLDFQDMAHLC